MQKQPTQGLTALLGERFGFASFRPHQQAICEAVTAGEDALVVMPTGAGKSLTYQLPGVARGGTTLVISPLIALIEDQAQKLSSMGFRAERIHSGLSREKSRSVCFSYLDGDLDFLFIAPERLGVPGFVEMLAKRRLALVAVDEAHCISHWGHDFRPDYRMLRERIPRLGESPVIALTATATPKVQDDILVQLGRPRANRFIHGFRRENIAIEMVEMTVSERADTACRLLATKGRRPAIIYAPTRKQAESVAAQLGRERRFKCAAYHAGMPPKERDEVQRAFLTGELEVIVATIAFGMGIDKSDIRTVVHLALPGSVEAYYQEIGRAGRDGEPSLAVLLYSYADIRVQEFFHERSYPEPQILEDVASHLDHEYIDPEDLADQVDLDMEKLQVVLHKLRIHGGAVIDFDERVRVGHDRWRDTYIEQREHKSSQLRLMARFPESTGCRMITLVRYFGDKDADQACGTCDVCAPKSTTVREFRTPTTKEARVLAGILDALIEWDDQATGRLFREVGTGMPRREFEALLGALVRADWLVIENTSFEKEGRNIPYRRVRLSAAGRRAAQRPTDAIGKLQLTVVAEKSSQRAKKSTGPTIRKKANVEKATSCKKTKTQELPTSVRPSGTEASTALVARIRAWRLEESRHRGVPAFRILTDRTLEAVAAAGPRNAVQLLAIKGIGPRLLELYGEELLELVVAVDSQL